MSLGAPAWPSRFSHSPAPGKTLERSCQGWELGLRVALNQWEILVATWVEVETPWGRSEPKGEEQAELTSERTSRKGTILPATMAKAGAS